MILLLGMLLSTAAIFCMTVGEFSWQNVVVGLTIGGALIVLFRRHVIPRPLPPAGLSSHLILYFPVLAWFLLIDIIKGTWLVTTITLGIRPLESPGIVKIPLGNHSPYGIGPVGYFVTLSPGTFLVDIDWDQRVMLVHSIDASNPDQVRRDAEKYYRLWEYGEFIPPIWQDPDMTKRKEDGDA